MGGDRSRTRRFRAASEVALEPVECRVFAADDLHRFLVAYPAAALQLLRLTIRNFLTADRRRVGAAALDAPTASPTSSSAPADAQHESELDIALTQEELASLLASSRESVVRALAALRTPG